MKKLNVLNRCAAALVVLAALGVATPVLAMTEAKQAPVPKTVANEKSEPALTAKQRLKRKRAKFPREWVWHRPTISFASMYARR